MNLSSISAIVGIVGSLSSAIYLIFYFLEKRNGKSKDERRNGFIPPVLPPDIALPPPVPVKPAVQSHHAVPPIAVDDATEFVKNEQAYQDWLKQHPQGFVVNTFAKAEDKAKCVILHKAGCGSIRHYKGRVTPGAYTEREYSKVCADDIASLARWAVRIGRTGEPFSGVCGLCRPPVPAPPLQSSHNVAHTTPKEITAPKNIGTLAASWTPQEFAVLLISCRALPPARGNYIINDYAENVLLTVLDFMLNTTIVENAAQHYKERAKSQYNDFNGLQNLLANFPDDKEGNTQVAEYLWGYKLWTRVGLLRRLLNYLGERGITTQEKLKEWAFQSEYDRDMAGKVKGIGFGIYKWLVMRQGVETIKPDIWVHRFVKQTIGRDLNDGEAVKILEAAAKEIGMKAYELDWRIWESQRNGTP